MTDELNGMFTLKRTSRSAHVVYNDERLKISDRDITLFGSINGWEVKEAIDKIKRLNKEKNAEKSKTPINLYLSSSGGGVQPGIDLAIAIRRSKIPVHIYAGSLIASVAITVLAAGHRRFATETTRFIQHNMYRVTHAEVPTFHTSKEFTLEAESMEHAIEIQSRMLERRTKLTAQEWLDLCGGPYKANEYSFDAQKALEIGLIDEIEDIFA